jgi:hypothetical protein
MGNQKKILLIHGRGPKPTSDQTKSLWIEALKTGIARDKPKLMDKFDTVPMELFYYADQFAEYQLPDYDSHQDLDDRLEALRLIQSLKKSGDFRRRHYDQLPGKTALKEFAMDAGVSLGLGGALERRLMPELAAYRQGDAPWVNQEKDRLTQMLANYFESGTDLLIISHCLGSVLAFDALWNLSNSAADEVPRANLITLGSPLGSHTVQQKLNGASSPSAQRYPANIQRWHNLSAEDDYVSHDKTVADDYRAMLRDELVEVIQDYTIYNPTLRFGRSNPHSSVGYLAHPRTASLIGDWLSTHS